MGRPANNAEKFWACAEIGAADECWPWRRRIYPNPKGRGGYGLFKVRYSTVLAHRLAFFFTHGRWPSPFCLHTCDNRACVNPAHLYEGTAKQNARDRDDRGRANPPIGERARAAKLCAQDVRYIRYLLGHGIEQKTVARMFRVRPPTISDINRGATWKHLKAEAA